MGFKFMDHLGCGVHMVHRRHAEQKICWTYLVGKFGQLVLCFLLQLLYRNAHLRLSQNMSIEVVGRKPDEGVVLGK